MKNVALIFMVVMIAVPGAAQQRAFSTLDSLISSARYEEAGKLISQLSNSNPDKKTSLLLANKTAEMLIRQGKLEDAETALQKIRNSNDPFLDAITETTLGYLYLNKARYDLALENLQRALAKFQGSGNRDSKEAAQCLADLSLLYWSLGKLSQAEENGLIALQLRQQLFGESSEVVAASYNDLGLVYGQSDPDKALDYYEKALAVYARLHPADHPKIAIAKTNIGIMYQKSKLFGDAINNFETAEAIWKKNYPDGHPSEALVLVYLGLTYDQMGNTTAALGYLNRALAIYQKSYGTKHPDISNVYNQIGRLKLGENNYDEALKNFQKAICANVPGFESRDIAVNPRVRDYYRGKVLLYSLRFKAQALESKHYGKTLQLKELRLALASLFSCDTLIDDIRHHSSDENDKIELGESANEVYEDGVRISESMSEMTVHFQHYREVAFYFAEKSKSAVLQESIADAEAKSFAGIPADLVEQEKTLKSAIAFLIQKLSQRPAPDEEKYLRESLLQLNQEYDAFIRKLETDYPNYFNLKFNSSSPRISALQHLLDKKTAIVSYFVAEKGKRVYQFIITQNRFRIRNLTLPAHYEKYVRGLTNSLLFGEIQTYNESARVLAKILIPPMPRSITGLVIIPSGRFGTLPFEALPYRHKKIRDFRSVPWTVERFAIGYEFSAGLLSQKAKNTSTLSVDNIFLCAPVTFPSNAKLPDLPGTESEVKTIGALFASASLATFGNATEDLAKSGKLANYKYLHFATHGIVDESNPELSRIFLNAGTQEDGNLFAGEIYTLNLHADLAVLSACQTGLGKFSKGEGVIGLSRALVYAGAKNIIVSFWSVADESTSQLMTDFYTLLLHNKNQNYRIALQQAKINMIRKGNYAAPYYWAPFVLIGF